MSVLDERGRWELCPLCLLAEGELSDTASSTKVRVFASRSSCLLSHLTAKGIASSPRKGAIGSRSVQYNQNVQNLFSVRASRAHMGRLKGKSSLSRIQDVFPDLTHSCVHAVRSAQASVRLTIGASVSVTHTLTDTHTPHGVALTTGSFSSSSND